MFQMKFRSWENDGDDNLTKSIFVKTQADVDFFTALAKMFSSTNSSDNGLGNEEYGEGFLKEVLDDLLEEHPDISPEVKALWKDEDSVYDNLCAYVLESPVQYDYGWCRVVEGIDVREVKEGALLKIEDEDNEVVFIDVVGDKVKYRKATHVMNGNVPDIYKVEWILKEVPLSEVDFSVLKVPTKVSKLVAQIKD